MAALPLAQHTFPPCPRRSASLAEAVLVLAVPDTVNWKNSVPATPEAPFVRDLAHRVSDSSPAMPNGG